MTVVISVELTLLDTFSMIDWNLPPCMQLRRLAISVRHILWVLSSVSVMSDAVGFVVGMVGRIMLIGLRLIGVLMLMMSRLLTNRGDWVSNILRGLIITELLLNIRLLRLFYRPMQVSVYLVLCVWAV